MGLLEGFYTWGHSKGSKHCYFLFLHSDAIMTVIIFPSKMGASLFSVSFCTECFKTAKVLWKVTFYDLQHRYTCCFYIYLHIGVGDRVDCHNSDFCFLKTTRFELDKNTNDIITRRSHLKLLNFHEYIKHKLNFPDYLIQ